MSKPFIVKLLVARTKADRSARNQLSTLIKRAIAVIEDVQGQPLSEEQRSQYTYALCAALGCAGFVRDVIDLLKPGGGLELEPDQSMRIALVAAAFIGDISLIKALLTKGVEPVFERPKPFPQPIQAAASQGNQDAVLLLLEHANHVLTNSWYVDTLDAAAAEGHHHVVRLLLEPNVKITELAYIHDEAVLSAAKGDHIHLVRFLLERECNTEPLLRERLLWTASRYGHVQLVRMILEGDVDINSTSPGSPSAIRVAASGGHAEVVRLLIAAGATRIPKRRVRRFDDPLCRAASNGREQVAQILLDAGDDINGRCASECPLHAAAAQEEIPMMRFLLKEGADVHAHGCGAQAMCTAAARGYDLVVRLLVTEGLSADGPGDMNQSPMLSAQMGGQNHVVKSLLELGAKPVDPAQTKYAADFASGQFPKRLFVD